MSDLRAALVSIQELHAELTVYEWDYDRNEFKLNSQGEQIVIARLCRACTPQSILDDLDDASYDASGSYDDVPFPCKTRELADEGLTDRMARTNQGENNE